MSNQSNNPEQNKKNSTFERLVSSISEIERNILLEKIHTLVGDPTTQEFNSEDKDAKTDYQSIDERLKAESLVYRFFLWLRSIFTNSSKEEIYNQDKVLFLFRKLDRSYAGLVDYKNGLLLNVFYQKFVELKTAVDFFKPYFDLIYENVGAYYVFLGSLICPEITKRMDSEVDPYNLPFEREVTSELRTSLIRKIEEILKDIPSNKRSYIYSCLTTVEWFYQLTKLPFDRLRNSFFLSHSNEFVCKFEIVTNELNAFAQVLCHGGVISEEVISSLYLYSVNKIVPVDSDAKDDESRLKEFMDKAMANISMIHMFIKTVPMRSICRIVFNNVQWYPLNFVGVEDWFVRFKEHWKKLFDEKWNNWIVDRKKEKIKYQLYNTFNLNNFPLIENRPWTTLWEGVPFHFEYTAGFICWFFENEYNNCIQSLKYLLLEGLFENKDNRQEFAMVINDLSQLHNDVYSILEELSPLGSIGLIFDKILANHLKTLQAQSKIESTMLNLESHFQSVKKSFCDDCRIIIKVVGAVLGNSSDTRYDGILNLAAMKSDTGKSFAEELSISLEKFSNALEIIKELETVDIPGAKG